MTAHDAGAVADLLAGSYAPTLRPFLTHAQPGVRAFLRAHVEHPRLFSGTELTVAVDDDRVSGFCEFTTSGSTSHLAYVAVAPEARHRGVATALIEDHLRRRGPAEVTLDVFDDNVPALRLYARLGFDAVAGRVWWTRPLPPAGVPPVVVDPAGSVAMHAAFGFSRLTVAMPDGNRSVGRTGETAVRCGTVDDFTDDALLAAVHGCVPAATDALVIVPDGTAPPPAPGAQRVARAARLVLHVGARTAPEVASW